MFHEQGRREARDQGDHKAFGADPRLTRRSKRCLPTKKPPVSRGHRIAPRTSVHQGKKKGRAPDVATQPPFSAVLTEAVYAVRTLG
jgi:hypothetical protein